MNQKGFIAKYWPYLFVAIPIGLQLIFFFYPLFTGIYYSLTDCNGLTSDFKLIGIQNYLDILKNPDFYTSMTFTIIFTIGLVIGEIVIGIWLASLLNRKIKAVGFFRTWYFFPAVLSTVTLGLIFVQLFNYGFTQIGEILHIDWLMENLLVQENTVIPAVLFVALWQGLAMPVIIFLSGLQSIPEDVKEAAAIDGASRSQQFFNIELPFLLPSISMVFILAMKSGLTAFDLIFALTSGGPDGKTESLGLLVYNYAFVDNKFSYANALAVVLFIFIIVISLIQMRISKKFEI
ncbi:TPA: sugar ABC transporter permease [Streptococcus suis 2524]|uniref:carbohydrate ABC transporter permease n=1 Tax=Streptococcus suis TaxID=1307 RepID=UPI000409BAB1|nr:sugar ABC transporter permease [Streptococcus suis]HEM3217715.1 sugar ABC transporter permease [Streptococcus suis 2524]HEM4180978.1 sugar ABC transporter permease [Streptococcus suis]HEM4978596.1 sugar ABC transporter permease [Streptococcus suis]